MDDDAKLSSPAASALPEELPVERRPIMKRSDQFVEEEDRDENSDNDEDDVALDYDDLARQAAQLLSQYNSLRSDIDDKSSTAGLGAREISEKNNEETSVADVEPRPDPRTPLLDQDLNDDNDDPAAAVATAAQLFVPRRSTRNALLRNRAQFEEEDDVGDHEGNDNEDDDAGSNNNYYDNNDNAEQRQAESMFEVGE